jgi:hypothetical protein
VSGWKRPGPGPGGARRGRVVRVARRRNAALNRPVERGLAVLRRAYDWHQPPEHKNQCQSLDVPPPHTLYPATTPETTMRLFRPALLR